MNTWTASKCCAGEGQKNKLERQGIRRCFKESGLGKNMAANRRRKAD